jgi:hypothetical protein
MATTIQTLIDQARRHLHEATARFWSDAELVTHANKGIKDLWRAINDNYQDYFLTIDVTNVSLAANSASVAGLPADVGVVRGIEPRVRTSYPNLTFFAKDYMHPDFANARAQAAFDPGQGGTIYWRLMGAGGPVAAPTIQIAPQVSAAVPLRLIYVPTLAELALAGNSPIPGESDQALIAWIVAYARAKERPDLTPDPSWLEVYSTEKKSILVSLTPRQTEDDEIAEALFEGYW